MSDDVPENRLPDSTEDGIPSVAGDGNDDETNTSTSPMGIGLSTLISSVIREFDSRADATSRSQDQLSFALDRLTGGQMPQFLAISYCFYFDYCFTKWITN